MTRNRLALGLYEPVFRMRRHDDFIDLTGSPDPPFKRKRRSATIDLSSPGIINVGTVDFSRPKQADEAGPSNYMQSAAFEETERQDTAAELEEEEPSTSKGKRKRSWAADRAKQAEGKKQQLKAQKAEAKAQRDDARAVKKARKAAEQKRVDQFGRTVRYASNAAEKTKERMARAMPSMAWSASAHCRLSPAE